MTITEYLDTSTETHARSFSPINRVIARTAMRFVRAINAWHVRRRDRAAFMNLLDKEEWVYEDMGIGRADVEWAARLPLHVNASLELEKLRARNAMGR
ncbi:hypothetical protein [Oricola thermophila]|uniref:DUF1127 domain-containing protein n=1 Tax=Oricola thermophila TaxID=2742145 RepID=A0A6N1VFM1_9HYPH|nr:hypothetical protein [Oricola thermophila]QKV19736.1 hypothetical protein HTY61_15370 [Oricola thermophila]